MPNAASEHDRFVLDPRALRRCDLSQLLYLLKGDLHVQTCGCLAL